MAEPGAPVANRAAARVTLDGRDLMEKIAPRLVSLTLAEKRAGEADQLDIVITDHDGRLSLPKEGARIRLELGWIAGSEVRIGLVDKGEFVVDDIEWGGPPDLLTVRARSADLTDGFRVRRERKRKSTTIGAIVAEIAGDNGLAAHVAPDLAAIEVKVLAQDQRSDMALLRSLGRRYDAAATVKNGRLVFAPIGAGVTATGKPLPRFTLDRRASDTVRYSRAKREEYGGVEARWHDQGAAKRRTVRAGGGKGKPKRLKGRFHSEADATAAALAEDRRVRRAAASLDYGCALGDAALAPDQRGRVRGLKAEIDAVEWLIAEATHSLDGAGGFGTRLKLETAI